MLDCMRTYPRIRFEFGGLEYRRVLHAFNRVGDVPRGDQFGVRELHCPKPGGKLFNTYAAEARIDPTSEQQH